MAWHGTALYGIAKAFMRIMMLYERVVIPADNESSAVGLGRGTIAYIFKHT